jgi:hypothetical protein
VLQDNVVNYLTIVTVDDPGGLLRPEMTANVTIELPGEKGRAGSAGGSEPPGARVPSGPRPGAGRGGG